MHFRSSLFVGSLVGLLALSGCSSSGRSGSPGGFVSDNPKAASPGDQAGEGSSGSTGAGGSAEPAPGGDKDLERTIAEADIIQIDGDHLYALSQYGGLNVIDVSNPDKLELLGRYRVSGIPFEMVLRDGLVFAMFTDWQTYRENGSGYWDWISTSRVEVIDVADPARIEQKGSFDMPGWIQDSRIVGDVLYAVSYEDGYCWNCQQDRNTTITSIDVGDPGSIHRVDQLRFKEQNEGYSWRRSISVTPDRMYVGGVVWNGEGHGHSTIQVVDISDPGGALELGAEVEVAGQIESRWQMDEHEGVLRVISQPGIWWNGEGVPSVQTFTVASSNAVTPLGSMDLVLPQANETLRSVRFDGPRAFAITAEQQDPLFTIDLSDPAAPKQLAEIEMPGFIYHMEPRGDRLFALGFDASNPGGSLNVTLFDVADLANPKLLRRVNFGGKWSSFSEDQDRIHKAFKIDDDRGLVTIPYAGWSGSEGGCEQYTSGIQLVDFTHADLALRGVAPSRGQARRAFFHDRRLFAVSDESVRTFDIADRDAPLKKADLSLATHVSQATIVGDVVARIAADWWTNEARLEIASLSDPGSADAIGTLDLEPLLGGKKSCFYGWGDWDSSVFALGNHLVLVWPSSEWRSTEVATIDLSDPSAPRVAGRATLPLSGASYYSYDYDYRIVSSGENVVLAGNALVFRRTKDVRYGDDYDPNALRDAWLDVVDLSDPANPTAAARVDLPTGAGHTRLRTDGGIVLTSHWVPLPLDETRARFFLDRIDVSNPRAPTLLTPINVPGSLAAYDRDSKRLLTVDYRRETLQGVHYQRCWRTFGYDASFEPASDEDWSSFGTCTGLHRSLKVTGLVGDQAVLLDTRELEDGYASEMWVGDARAFLQVYSSEAGMTETLAVGWTEGSIRTGAVRQGDDVASMQPLAAVGKRLLGATYAPYGIAVVDATDLDAMVFENERELSSYPYQVTIAGDRALCSLGPYGLEVVDLAD